MTKNQRHSPEEHMKITPEIFDQMPAGVLILQSGPQKKAPDNFPITYANSNAAGMLGFESIISQGNFPDDLNKSPLFQKIINACLQTTDNQRTRNDLEIKNENRTVWIRTSILKSGHRFFIFMDDISGFKETIATLKIRGKKYQQLFDESIDPIFVLDKHFKISDANESFRALFEDVGEMEESLSVGSLFYHFTDFEYFRSMLEKNKKIDELEVPMVSKTGALRHCLINSASVFDAETKDTHYLGVIRDMTRRKQAEEDIIAAEKLSMTGKLARTIGHEVRNPLTNLFLALEQLREEVTDNENAELYIKIIERNANRISKLITDLLNSSKPKQLKLVRQSLRKLIEDTLWLVRDRINLQNMQLIESYPEKDILMSLDNDQFKIALLNLLINAIEAMKPDLGILKISFYTKNKQLILQVEDNGVGISEKDQKQLFEPFFTAKKEGSGLGLTAVQNIIHSHKGRIAVHSQLGKGTTFTLTFPQEDVE